MDYTVCHLTAAQAARFERKGELPACEFHRHEKVSRAHDMVGVEGYGLTRWVGVNYRYMTDITPKTWAKKLSGPVAVMQLVRGGRGPVNRPLLANAT